jgi:hypothetical protein
VVVRSPVHDVHLGAAVAHVQVGKQLAQTAQRHVRVAEVTMEKREPLPPLDRIGVQIVVSVLIEVANVEMGARQEREKPSRLRETTDTTEA